MRVKLASLLCALLLLPSHSMADDLSKRISQANAVADVHQFFSTLQRVHPDLLAKVSLDDYIKLKQQTKDGIAKKLDKDGKIGVTDFEYLLCYAAAFFQDAHTAVGWDFSPKESNTTGIRFPPFLLGYDNGHFVIASSSDESIKGLEVLSVDGKSALEFLRPILDHISGETLAFKASCFWNNQESYYSFSGLCGSLESLHSTLRNAEGKESHHNLPTLGFADFHKLHSDWWNNNKQYKLRRQGTQVYFLDSDRIAHFVYPQFDLSEEEKKKVDGVFQQIKAKGSQDLIIDIRANGGGDSSMGDFIFSYLYDGKFQQFSKVRVKLSPEALSLVGKDPEIPESASADIGGLIVDGLITKCQGYTSLPAFFSGRVFLLTNNGTFSSASSFATMFRDYGVGKIIGHETGGVPVCFGNYITFNLTNSGIQCAVSFKQFINSKPRPGDDEHGVIPDIPMTDKLLKAYQKEDDPVLAYTLDYIKKSR